MLTIMVLASCGLAILVAPLYRIAGRGTGGFLAAGAAVLAMALATSDVMPVRVETYPWAPSLGLELSFVLDGLSRFFALLVAGVGAAIFLYAGTAVDGDRTAGLLGWLVLFFGSMLGLVLSENLLTLFVFWELTSVSSYLLIGFKHERAAARSSAQQALLVTTAAGLALLVGLVIVGQVAGSYSLMGLAGRADELHGHPLYAPAVLLVLIGAFAKSAQVPLHFWLPNAMVAPTAVSAYLHSSTMVTAGVFLLARLTPVLGGTVLWATAVSTVGVLSMVVGAVFAVGETAWKRLLAYSTMSVLGLATMLIGLGTEGAARAAFVVLLAHALYKGALFLVAGNVIDATGEQELPRLRSLARVMPVTAAAATLAAASMGGLPPLAGFLAKEEALQAALQGPGGAWLTGLPTLVASSLLVAAACAAGAAPFWCGLREDASNIREGSPSRWLPPLALAASGAVVGLFPAATAGALAAGAASVMLGGAVVTPDLTLWHGLTPPLLLGVAALAAGVALFFTINRYRRVIRGWPSSLTLDAAYDSLLDGVHRVAVAQTHLIQCGHLRHYLLITLVTVIVYAGSAAGTIVDFAPSGWLDIRLHEVLLVAVTVAAAIAVIRLESRLGAVAALGIVGYGVATIFVLFSAPDLAMTQFTVDTLTVVLLVFAFYDLAPMKTSPARRGRWRDLTVSGAAGLLMVLLVLAALDAEHGTAMSDYFVERSVPDGHGSNVVNVILVDFRALDTLGEISVLGIAAAGVFALLRRRSPRRESP